MNLHNFLHNWILPPMIYRTIGQFYFENSWDSEDERRTLSKNAQFYNKYQGRRCFVIMNGQSLNSLDLTLLKNEVTIAINHFSLHPIIKIWQPNFLCVLEPKKSYEDTSKHHLLKSIYTNISPTDGFCVNISTKPLIESFNILDKKIFYIKTTVSIETLINTDKYWDLKSSIPGGESTSILGIILAMYIGCREIYLIGMDHDWLASKSSVPTRHFYDQIVKGDSSYDDISNSYTDTMKSILKLFLGYKIIKQYAGERGIHIWNATPGGFVDIFPRIDYTTLFGVDKL